MSLFDTHVVVDWSGGNDRGATPKKDAIWIGVNGAAPVYLRNRQLAEAWLVAFIKAERAARRNVLIGFDFPFAYPKGFGHFLTGSNDPLAVWDWFEQRVDDSAGGNNRFDLAAGINSRCHGVGPFWGNGLSRDIDDLPRKGLARTCTDFAEWRHVETRAKGSFSCWQLSGAGAVGSQVIMGLPMLARLRSQFGATVWPFELAGDLHLIELWPSLLADAIKAEMAPDEIKDAAQVRISARTLARLDAGEQLGRIFEQGVQGGVEGWIFGVGSEETFRVAARALVPPPLSNDCFSLPPGVDWTPVDTALEMLRSRMRRVVGATQVAVPQANGRILARDMMALRSNPPAANSAVDGYGFAHGATGDGAQHLPLVTGRAAAGAAYQGTVPHGHAIRILTGAVLPKGVDTVVLEEDCRTDGAQVAFRGPVKPGANTRKAGEDVAAGDLALASGRICGAQDLALLTALGVAVVPVFERLRVGVLSTGDELIAPGSDAPPDRTFDANRPMLLAMLDRWGHMAVDLGHVGDDRAALRACLDAAQVHAIVTTGGASAGDEDHVSALLRAAGALGQWRIALKPGRPLALGVWQGTPVFGLPGNPVAAFTTALIFARPALSQLAGGPWLCPTGYTVPAAFSKRKKPGRREFLRARMTADGAAEVFASEGSGRISGLSWSDGFVELPDAACHITPGTPVRYLPYAGFGL